MDVANNITIPGGVSMAPMRLQAAWRWQDLVALCRPKQWVKNGFVFLPIIFGLKLHQPALWVQAAWVFLAFSLVASAIYCLNDWQDMARDRAHPLKCLRPLASGRVSVGQAQVLMSALLVSGLMIAGVFGGGLVLALMSLYGLLNVLYCLRVKHVALLDITFVATGFVLRVIAGAVATGITPSVWIILMTFLLALFLALAKRRDDLVLADKGTTGVRANLDGYNKPFVDGAMLVMAAVVIVGYVQYTVSPEVVARFGTPWVFVTTLFVVLGMLRYLQLTLVYQASGSPTTLLWTDRFLQLTIAAWLLTFIGLIYG
jgi:decaprenyl-phosphate phosphoribosyltransferase